MKLLVFAHIPPPHHGQSYMVQLMLEGFGGDHRKKSPRTDTGAPGSRTGGEGPASDHPDGLGITCYHVDARLSKKLEDIGTMDPSKLFLLVGYCLQAIWCRWHYGVTNFYYVPAPGKKSALYRDWLVMLICRPFFKKVILHWHAAGLARWLETVVQMRSRVMTYKLMKRVDLSIVLSKYNRADAEKLFPNGIAVVGNGIPDPCPDFERAVLPRRQARAAARKKLLAGETLSAADLEKSDGDPRIFQVLFLAHCTREKGLFDALDGVALANQLLFAANYSIRVQLTVAGAFFSAQERADYERRVAYPDLQVGPGGNDRPGLPKSAVAHSPAQPLVTYRGFVTGAEKSRLFAESDCFCFPTYFYAESFGLVLVEAMAFGLSIVTSRWRSIPELMPANYPGLVEPRHTEQIADGLIGLLKHEMSQELRQHFLSRFTAEQHLANLAAAFHSIESHNQSVSLRSALATR